MVIGWAENVKKTSKWHVLICFVFGLVMYGLTWNHGYVYDDEIVIVQNIHVQKGTAGISNIWTHNYLNGVAGGYNDGLYRPISPTMFAIEKQIFGKNPVPSHIVNVFVYALTGIALYLFLLALFKGNSVFALTGTLIFLAHPIHTEVVSNIKSRDELMAGLFGILALYWTTQTVKDGIMPIVLMWIFYVLALFSKESSVSLLLVIPSLYVIIHEKIKKQFYFLISLLLSTGVIWYMWHQKIINSMPQEIDPGLFSNLSNAVLLADNKIDQMSTGLWITVMYVLKTVIPYPLSCDYSPNAIIAVPLFSAKGIFSLILLTVIFIAGFLDWLKNKGIVGFGVLLFFLILAPVSNVFMAIGTSMGERLAYMPSLGWCLILTVFFHNPKIPFKHILIPGLIILFSGMTMIRSLDWKSNLTLYAADINKQPDSFRTHYNYASALSASVGTKTGEQLSAEDRKNLEMAVSEFYQVLRIRPDYADGYNNLGNTLRKLGRVDEALVQFRYLVHAKPDYQKGLYNIAIIYYERQQYDSAHFYFMAHTKMPHVSTSGSWYFAGVSSGYLAKFDDAILELTESVKLDPSKYDAWNFLGMAFGNLGKTQEAYESFKKAYELNGGKDAQITANFEQSKKALENIDKLQK